MTQSKVALEREHSRLAHVQSGWEGWTTWPPDESCLKSTSTDSFSRSSMEASRHGSRSD